MIELSIEERSGEWLSGMEKAVKRGQVTGRSSSTRRSLRPPCPASPTRSMRSGKAEIDGRRVWLGRLHGRDLAAIEAVLQRGRSARPTTSGAGSRPPSWRSPTGAGHVGQARVAQGDRARSARPRPPLPARLLQDPQRSWAGRRRVSWEQGLAATVRWYAANREWWEPLRCPAPVVEGGLAEPAEPADSAAGPDHRGRRAARARPARRAGGAGAGRRPPVPPARRPRGPGTASTMRSSPPTSTPCASTTGTRSRHVVARVPARAGPPRRGIHRGRRLRDARSTGLRGQRRRHPSRGRGGRAVGAHLVTSPPTTSSTGRWTGPTASGTPPTPARSTDAASSAARGSAAPGSTIVRNRLGVRGPRGQHGQDGPAAGRGRRTTLRFVDDQHGSPDLHGRPGRRRSSRSGWTAGPAPST